MVVQIRLQHSVAWSHCHCHWLVVWVWLACFGWLGSAFAQTIDTTPTPTPTPNAPLTSSPRFQIEWEIPHREARNLLSTQTTLVQLQKAQTVDQEELMRTLTSLEDDVAKWVGTLGYFRPKTTWQWLAVTPPASDGFLGVIQIQVNLGEPSRVASHQVFIKGGIEQFDDRNQEIERLKSTWSLESGALFTQAKWEQAKTNLLKDLHALRWAKAKIINSLADVVADRNRQEVNLFIEIDTGPLVKLGETLIEGTKRYPADELKRQLAEMGITSDTEYSLVALQQAQQQLAKSGLYESVFVHAEPNETEIAPVKVQLREAQRQRLVFAIGGSTDSGLRLSLEHRHRQLGIGGQLTTQATWQTRDQMLRTEWRSNLGRSGWRDVLEWQGWQQRDPTQNTITQTLRIGEAQDPVAFERSFFVQYDTSRTITLSDTFTKSSSVLLSYAWTGREFDQLPLARSGRGLGFEIGWGTTLTPFKYPFLKGTIRGLHYINLGSTLDLEGEEAISLAKQPRWALRWQLGGVAANPVATLPASLLYMAGGENSVRGYPLRSIGITSSDGSTVAGRFSTLLGVEWQKPLAVLDGQTLEHVLFVDGGAVDDQWDKQKLHLGVGTGLRLNTPVGPLQTDLAYGLDLKRWRLHLRVGFVF